MFAKLCKLCSKIAKSTKYFFTNYTVLYVQLAVMALLEAGTNFQIWRVKVGKKVCWNGQNIKTNKMPNIDKNQLIFKKHHKYQYFLLVMFQNWPGVKSIPLANISYHGNTEHNVFWTKVASENNIPCLLASLSCASGTNITFSILSWRKAGQKIIYIAIRNINISLNI